MKVEIGKSLKKLRVEKRFTQKELARRVRGGLDYTYIGKIERGEQLPSLKILLEISEALSVPVSYFFQDEASAALHGLASSELRLLAKDEKGRELLRTLHLLHKEDIPLIIGIIQVLNRHRKGEKRKPYAASNEPYPLAAEDDTLYGKTEE